MSFTFAYDIAPPIMLLTVSFQVLDDPNAKVKVPPHVVENPSSNVKVEVPPPIVAPLVIATPFENPSGNVKSEVPYVDTNVEVAPPVVTFLLIIRHNLLLQEDSIRK